MIVLMEFVIYLALVVVGLCLGSFAGATVWRLRARQLRTDKSEGESYDKAEYARLKKLTTASVMKDRSQCLHCSYELKWYDLLPLVSWITLGGKCRKCRHPIGYLEPFIEFGVAAFFVASYALWPYDLVLTSDIARFVLWLIAGAGLAILAAYDTKWFLLPNKINFGVVGIGAIISVLVITTSADPLLASVGVLAVVLILSGVYLTLYLMSKGRWIGFGDIKLGLGLALLLADWQLAFIAIFAANLIGCLIVIPGMAMGKIKRNSHIPFGPLLIAGAVIAQLVGPGILDWYMFALL
jgi:leader peptidase (prepilin peptidase) / N-methyltransferase